MNTNINKNSNINIIPSTISNQSTTPTVNTSNNNNHATTVTSSSTSNNTNGHTTNTIVSNTTTPALSNASPTSTSTSSTTATTKTKIFLPYSKLTKNEAAVASTTTTTMTTTTNPTPTPIQPPVPISKTTFTAIPTSTSSTSSVPISSLSRTMTTTTTTPTVPSASISKVSTTTTTPSKTNIPSSTIPTTTTNIRQPSNINTTSISKPTVPTTSTTTTTYAPTADSLKRPPPPSQEIEEKKVIKKKRLVGPLTIAEEDFIANAFKNVPDTKLSTDVKRIKRKFLLREYKRSLNLETFDLDIKVQQYASHMKKKDQKVSIYFTKEEIPAVFSKKPLHSLENLNGVIDEKVNELAHPLQVFSTQQQQHQQQLLEKQQQELERKQQLERQQELERQQQLEKWRRELKDTTVYNDDGIHSMIVHAEYLLNDKKPMIPIPPPPPPQPKSTDSSATSITTTITTITSNNNSQDSSEKDNDLKKHYHWTNEKILCPKRDLEQLIKPYISPHTTRELKSFIRRDYETVPRCVSLLRELYQFFIANGMVEYSPLATEFYPIDYRYLTPDLVDKTQWFLCEEFWPGIDLNEILEYPDFTVVAMYRNMVIGCGMMNPDGYIMYLAVRPGWNGNGIASFMLYHLTQTMVGRDITLHVSTNNTAMILYQKFGFKIEEHIAGFYDKFYSNESGRSKNAYLLRLRR
ncbi:hypothetical protein PPL_10304 [Heterostelium album PN500]|uniref:N-acetyltransferase domain-containing protein n=1 Tax=Heterostelium pallidum (strain ATCC 26659 / Pp 5 / PN500) TaxID=670386 RepID=D3BPY5_HETP5|nr:hypothetical protein PPL_10304 [Heterostelium album PN500]EFA76536.1 hypothetical protein PPL_10304 [Heterostelium album PN500]|eukprot:XP_020428668.1 hypothetical protein PPL_10304 [Heterostelium album PN500]